MKRIWLKALLPIMAAAVIIAPQEVKADAPGSSESKETGSSEAHASHAAPSDTESSTSKDTAAQKGAASPYISPDVITENTSGKPFAIEGNGNLVDDAYDDDTKEFITVRTKNNQTFFVVIDRANSANNVYMLSMIDEDDLEQFLNEDSGDIQIEDISDLASLEEDTTESGQAEKKKGSGATLYIILIIAAAGILGGYYYIRIYKPRKEEQEADSEGMENNDWSNDYDRGEVENEDTDEEENEYDY